MSSFENFTQYATVKCANFGSSISYIWHKSHFLMSYIICIY